MKGLRVLVLVPPLLLSACLGDSDWEMDLDLFDACSSDDDCLEGTVCKGAWFSEECVEANLCETNDDCAADEHCRLRHSFLGPRPTRETCVANRSDCRTDDDCPADSICPRGCISFDDVACMSAQVCITDDECLPDEHCDLRSDGATRRTCIASVELFVDAGTDANDSFSDSGDE